MSKRMDERYQPKTALLAAKPEAVKVTVTRTGPPPNATWNGQDVYVPPASGGQPGIPDGWRLAPGWLSVRPETRPGRSQPGCLCSYAHRRPAIAIRDRDGLMVCAENAANAGAIVPAEPSRPGEAGRAVRSSAELSPDDPRIRWPVVFARWSNGDPCGDEATSKDEVENLGRSQWDNGQFNVTLWEPIAPPAPGNHPGTPESSDVIECKTGNFPYRWMRFIGEVQQGSNDKVTWVQTRPAPGNHPGTPPGWQCPKCNQRTPLEGGAIPYRCPNCNPSKPDEAPLSERMKSEYMKRFLASQWPAMVGMIDEVAGLESELADARTVVRLTEERLATRDARIAGLEASYAADKAAAVLEERARCLAVVDDAIAKGYVGLAARATIASGAPAPSGGK